MFPCRRIFLVVVRGLCSGRLNGIGLCHLCAILDPYSVMREGEKWAEGMKATVGSLAQALFRGNAQSQLGIASVLGC